MIDILDLADKAARCVLRGRPCWAAQDWQDATQEAARAIWERVQERPDLHEGHLFLAAKSAIYDWLRVWLRHPRGGTLIDYLGYAQGENVRPATCLRELAPLLRRQRSRKVSEDLRYLGLRMAGYSTDGIAQELGISVRNVYAIRERLLPRLERIARNEAAPARRITIREGSRAALERINSDPVMRTRRGAAIRVALARKKETAL